MRVFTIPQMQLPLFPEWTTEINANLAFIKKENQVTYSYWHLPIHEICSAHKFF